jgi:hypothetical protein
MNNVYSLIGRNLKERDHLKDQSEDRRIILKYVLEISARIDLAQDNPATDLYEDDNESSCSLKDG